MTPFLPRRPKTTTVRTRTRRHLMVFIAGLVALNCGSLRAANEEQTTSHATGASESNGLRLEVTATLEDIMSTQGEDFTWSGASLAIAIALRNTSTGPITVPTTPFDESPRIQPNGDLTHVFVYIDSPNFMGEPTVFVPSRFAPATLGPGERVLVLSRRIPVRERALADSLKQIAAVFGVPPSFGGPKDWWRGNLRVETDIKRNFDPDQYIAQLEAAERRLQALREAEKDPNYGPAHAAYIASLISGSDMAQLRNEVRKDNGPAKAEVHDAKWIQGVSAAVAKTSLAKSNHCFCTGWLTAHFYREGKKVVSIAAIHGNQLRIQWGENTGDYAIPEAEWKAVEQALGVP